MPNVPLRHAIVDDGRRQYQIAAAVEVNPSLLSGIITGRIDPSEEVARRLAAELDRPVDELFPGFSR